jgi:hypothetical protein
VAKEGLIDRFLARMGLRGGQGVDVLENPTEELVDGILRGNDPTVYRMAKGPHAGKKKIIRKEENYLWSTRRFPGNTANDTIGAGALTTDDYPYFGNGVGDGGSAMGYYSIPNLTFLQTNMDKGGRVPTGRGFAMFELAASFNANAKSNDIATMLDCSELRFSKNNDDFSLHHGPLRLWPGGTGVSGFAGMFNVSGGAGPQYAASNGMQTMAAVRRFKQPRLLSANESFTYILHTVGTHPNNNATAAVSDFVEVCLWLFGFHYIRQSS